MGRDAQQLGTRGLAGVGLGLRWEFAAALARELPDVPFLEIAPENYIGRGGEQAEILSTLRRHYPILTHGLTMSLGGTAPLDYAYLDSVGAFIEEVGSPFHSDHLCFSVAGGKVLHELLPIRHSRAAAHRIASRVEEVVAILGVPFAVENISAYVVHEGDQSEAELLASLVANSPADLLLDLNNAVVNATNFGGDAREGFPSPAGAAARAFIRALPLDRVMQLHVAGAEWIDSGGERILVDTHGAATPPLVIELLGEVIEARGAIPVVLERDQNIPPLAALLAEREALAAVVSRALARRRDRSAEEHPVGG